MSAKKTMSRIERLEQLERVDYDAEPQFRFRDVVSALPRHQRSHEGSEDGDCIMAQYLREAYSADVSGAPGVSKIERLLKLFDPLAVAFSPVDVREITEANDDGCDATAEYLLRMFIGEIPDVRLESHDRPSRIGDRVLAAQAVARVAPCPFPVFVR